MLAYLLLACTCVLLYGCNNTEDCYYEDVSVDVDMEDYDYEAEEEELVEASNFIGDYNIVNDDNSYRVEGAISNNDYFKFLYQFNDGYAIVPIADADYVYTGKLAIIDTEGSIVGLLEDGNLKVETVINNGYFVTLDSNNSMQIRNIQGEVVLAQEGIDKWYLCDGFIVIERLIESFEGDELTYAFLNCDGTFLTTFDTIPVDTEVRDSRGNICPNPFQAIVKVRDNLLCVNGRYFYDITAESWTAINMGDYDSDTITNTIYTDISLMSTYGHHGLAGYKVYYDPIEAEECDALYWGYRKDQQKYYSEGLFYASDCFYNNQGEVVIDLTEYDVEDDYQEGYYFIDGYCPIVLNNPEGIPYYTIIDKTGEFLFEPRKLEVEVEYLTFLNQETYTYRYGTSMYIRYLDLEGNIINDSDYYYGDIVCGFNEGFAVVNDVESGLGTCYFIDINGSKVF